MKKKKRSLSKDLQQLLATVEARTFHHCPLPSVAKGYRSNKHPGGLEYSIITVRFFKADKSSFLS